MAEIAVSIVVDRLVSMLEVEAINLVSGSIHKEVKSMKDELEIIAAFLKEADAKEARGESNDFIKAWMKQVIHVAYRIEDAIDEYSHHVSHYCNSNQQEQTTLNSKRTRFKACLYRNGRLVVALKPRHKLAREIEDIKATVRDIKDRGRGYGLHNSAAQGTSSTNGADIHPPISYLFVDEAELVGIEAPKDILLSWFAEEQLHRMVFSLVGMGGVGKTTLAKKVLDSQKGRFDCHAWITVSQTYSMMQVLRSLVHQFHRACKESAPSGMNDMNEVMLIEHLQEYVKQKRYLVAFDDTWNIKFWEDMDLALPDYKNCSRIIITARNENAAPSSVSSALNRVPLLRPLSLKKSWKLFCKKVFHSPDHKTCCPLQLQKLSKAMVEKCEGLPLAIVTIGGILSTKEKNVPEWQKFYNSLETKLENNENLTKVLSLSYHDLPFYLKPCLLYFGLFPEDYSIRGSILIRQWIAEGFVKTNGAEVMEDIAENYLMELVRRNLIHVSEVDYSNKAREFRVHDLVRDFIHLKSKEQRFGRFTKSISNDLDDQGRRLSISHNSANILFENIEAPPARSVFFFHMLEFPKKFSIALIEKFKFLNMLDFEDAPLTFLPDEVGNLVLLKHLSIRNTKVERIPKSIGKLQQLETLDMKNSLVLALPKEIKRLHKLRHLLARKCEWSVDYSLTSVKGVKIPEGLGCKQTLQKLSYVEADGIHGIIRKLTNFTQLRKLGIVKVTRADGIELCSALENLKQLSSLTIRVRDDEDEVLDLQQLVSPPPLLQRVILEGKIEMLPSWISKLRNVVRLRLRWCGFTDDPLQAIQQLPNLLDLVISYHAYTGEQMHFRIGGFKKLRWLELRHLKTLKKLIVDKGALSNLEKLDIGPSLLLKEVPYWIQHLTNLQHVHFFDMPNEFWSSMAKKPEQGPNYTLIRHIPNAYVAFKCGPFQHTYYRLK